MKYYLLIFLSLVFVPDWVSAQNQREGNPSSREMERNLNSLRYTVNPLLAAVMVGKGKWEINQFNTLQRFKLEQRRMGENVFTGEPENTCIECFSLNTLDHGLQIQFGVSQNYRFNIGLDLYGRNVRSDTSLSSSIFDVFNSGEEPVVITRGVSAIGPRIRWMPFRLLPELTINSAILFGWGSDGQRKAFARDRVEWQTNVVFLQSFGQRFSIAFQPSSRIFFESELRDSTSYLLAGTLSLSSYLTGLTYDKYPKLSVFATLYHEENFETNPEGNIYGSSNATRTGLGFLAQFNPQFLLYITGETTLSENTKEFNRRFFDTVDRNDWNVLSLGVRLYLPRP